VSISRLKFFRNLRTVIFLTVFTLLVTVLIAIGWVNYTGLPSSWRVAIESELSKQGIETSISRLRYIPLRGVEASSVIVFADAARTRPIAHLERLIFDLDKTKILQGEVRLTHIDLHNANLSIPVDMNDPDSETLDITDLNGKVLMSRGRKFEITQAQGFIGGISLTVNATILGFRPVPGEFQSDESSGLHRKLMKKFIQELSHWNLDHQHPPEMRVTIEADANKWSSLKGNFNFSCPSISRDDLVLENLRASGTVVNFLITVTHFEASDARGKIQSSFDYDLISRMGHYDANSSIDALAMVHTFTGKQLLTDFSFAELPKITVKGNYSVPKGGKPIITAQGRASTHNALFRGSPINELDTEFSWSDHNVFLRNLHIKHATGTLLGKALYKDGNLRIHGQGELPLPIARPFYRDHKLAPALAKLEDAGIKHLTASFEANLTKNETFVLDTLEINELKLDHQLGNLTGNLSLIGPLISYRIESTLPASIWQPFFPDQPLEKVLGDFTANKNTQTQISLVGSIDRNTPKNWTVKGDAEVKNISYRNVPVHSAKTSLDLRHHSLKFSDVSVDFDYTSYDFYRSFQGSNHGPTKAALIAYDHDKGTVAIDDLRGSLYPAPLLRMFAVSAADALESFRFRGPPSCSASGIIDVRNQTDTKLAVSLKQGAALDWMFLGKMVTFSDIASEIMVRNDDVTLSKLSFRALDGKCAGSVRANIRGRKEFNADLYWNKISMSSLAETYAFQEKGYGTLTGRISIAGVTEDTNTLNGEGLCSLEKGELFAVPLFGPLSPVIAGVLGDRRAGFERAKDAFCNFSINKGIIVTNDFETQTSTLKFTGNGSVNINKDTIDMTIRMNARGLLGIITLPLQPIIKGLFQFQGQGPIKNPKWEHVIFTSPPEKEKQSLLHDTPRRAIVVPED
jgi:AsmA-like C-terminal region